MRKFPNHYNREQIYENLYSGENRYVYGAGYGYNKSMVYNQGDGHNIYIQQC